MRLFRGKLKQRLELVLVQVEIIGHGLDLAAVLRREQRQQVKVLANQRIDTKELLSANNVGALEVAVGDKESIDLGRLTLPRIRVGQQMDAVINDARMTRCLLTLSFFVFLIEFRECFDDLIDDVIVDGIINLALPRLFNIVEQWRKLWVKAARR